MAVISYLVDTRERLDDFDIHYTANSLGKEM
jgi:hypothetical protein